MRKSKVFIIVATLAFIFVFAGAALAVPIELIHGEVTKLKFVNYENFIDANANNTIDAGDYFEGIFNTESISNIPNTIDKSGQLLSKELTGHFKISVVGGAIPIGGAGHVDFGLMEGDFINLYVGEGTTKNWDPAAADAIARASDGTLWASILPQSFYEGINDTTFIPPVSFNRNWANVTINLTGYNIIPLLYPEATPESPWHFIDVDGDGIYTAGIDIEHASGHIVDTFFTSTLTTPSGIPQWDFKSEDPYYINVSIPEPGTLLLLGVGLVGVATIRRRFKR